MAVYTIIGINETNVETILNGGSTNSVAILESKTSAFISIGLRILQLDQMEKY